MPAASLPTADLLVLIAYFVGITALGCWFLRSSRTSRDFMLAGTGLPGWAVGLSIFATFLSSNTFLGIPGKAYAGNWNALVFSFSLPVAAWIAVRFFVPFYRRGGEISAYAHLERRFGPWARLYALACYLMTQLARMGSIMFGTALALQSLVHWPIETIILLVGLVSTLYTMLGGIRAVVWTDVAQSFILLAGAVAVLLIALFAVPGGPIEAARIAAAHDKFELGSFSPDPRESTFWVVLLYGLFINLTNFGIDQNYVQRYLLARNDRAAARSVWLGALLYVPVSLLFFMIGTALFAYYQSNPVEAAGMTAVGDRVLPHFIATRLPPGLAGLVISAILAAAMSTIDSSLNASATVYLKDIHQRHLNPALSEKGAMRVLHLFTLLWGLAGTGAALAMIGIQSILDAWWNLSGIFAGGMLGLFLLGMLFPRAGPRAAAVGVVSGVAIIAWMTLSRGSALPAILQSPFHASLIIVIGTLAILATGAAAGLSRSHSPSHSQT